MSVENNEETAVAAPTKELNVEKVIKDKKLNCKLNEKGLLVKRTQLAD